jgi:lipid-A-disaccharide synthase
MVSGSVSLEVLARGKPAAVMYHGSLLMGTLTWFLIHCKYMSLPNLIAGRMVMPERPFMVRVRKHTKWFAGILDNWLSDPAAMESTRQEMAELRANVATTGGIVRAVDSLLRTQKTIFRKAA